jgi:hypothetical protein
MEGLRAQLAMTTRQVSNREKQVLYFEDFRKHYSLPEGIIEHDDKPDVIVRGERTLGIEVTNFYLEDGLESEQVQRGWRDQVLSDAQAIYQRTSSGRTKLTLGFDESVPIRDKGVLANKIAELGLRVEDLEAGPVRRDLFFEDIPELFSVWCHVDEYEDSAWRLMQGHSGSLMSLESLRDIIKGKEAKLRQYKPCDAYWLLVVVDFFDFAQDQEIMIEGGLNTIRSEVFEKILVYKTVFGQVLETSGQGR